MKTSEKIKGDIEFVVAWPVPAEQRLKFEIEGHQGIQLIHVHGPLDSMTYDHFRKFMDAIIRESRVRVVLDCRNLTYINSRGLSLLGHYQRMAPMGFSYFGVAGFSPRICKGIHRLRLENLVSWFPTLEEALQMAAAM